MIRFNLKKLIEDKEFHEDRRVTIMEIAEETGISRNTLSKIINRRGYDTSVGNLEKLCLYFKCGPEQLIRLVPDPRDDQ